MAFWCLLSARRKIYILHGIRFKRVHYYKSLSQEITRICVSVHPPIIEGPKFLCQEGDDTIVPELSGS
jgi:hypothetical protein